MDMGLQDKAALGGGASRGIGKAIAMGLAREGCRVMLAARNEGPLAEAMEEIKNETGTEATYVVCDMGLYKDIKAAVNAVTGAFGRLDVLVNNAGGPPSGVFNDVDDRFWQHAVDQNMLSAVRATREALPSLRRSGSGRIINILSVSVKQPIDGLILSNATRLAVVGMAKTLSREIAGEGVTVNNICPGNIATQRLISLIEGRAQQMKVTLEQAVALEESRVPAGYLGDPQDVAALAVFLASVHARFITGTTIQVDGGSTTAVM
jgi:3-oxoacyl-[acyl-carrier protein] reductase